MTSVCLGWLAAPAILFIMSEGLFPFIKGSALLQRRSLRFFGRLTAMISGLSITCPNVSLKIFLSSGRINPLG